MKRYTEPEILVDKLNVEDVITTSSTEEEGSNCGFDMGLG